VHGLLRAVWVVAAAAILAAAVAAIVTVVSGPPGNDDVKTVYSLVAVFLCAGATVGGLHLVERPRLRLLGVIVLVIAAGAFTLLELGIWKSVIFDGESSEYAKLIPIGFAWGIAAVVLATLPLVAVQPRIFFIAVPLVGACALVGATIATVMVWREVDSTGWGKTLAVVAIIMIAGYLLTPLAERLTRSHPS
jgi:hypothetical protein